MAASNSRAKIGLGTKVVFTQSGSIGEIMSLSNALGLEGTSFDASHLGMPTLDEVSANGQKIPGGIVQITDMSGVIHFDPANGIPPMLLSQTIEVVLPKRSTELSAAKFSATGWLQSFNASMTPNEKMQGNFVIAFTGAYVYTKPTLLAAA
jgi:hypothetical protein